MMTLMHRGVRSRRRGESHGATSLGHSVLRGFTYTHYELCKQMKKELKLFHGNNIVIKY